MKDVEMTEEELIELAAFLAEKEAFKDYEWNDEQFQRLWDNPEKNNYVESKQKAIQSAKIAFDVFTRIKGK